MADEGCEVLARLLPGLGRHELELVERYSAPATVRSGRTLVYQGDEASAAFLLVAGKLRPVRIKGSSSTPFEDLLPGSWPCLAEAMLGRTCLLNMLASGDCTLRRFGHYNLAALLREPWFKELALGVLARSLYCVYGAMEASNATERVARALAARSTVQADADAKTLRLELGQAELAESTGLTRETVNRSLARLERAGIVETERGAVLVYDIEGLRTYEE